MKEPAFYIEHGSILLLDEKWPFDGFAQVSDKYFELGGYSYGVNEVFVIGNKLLAEKDGAQCADGGWFYVWEFEPDASVFFVQAGESDTFDALEVQYHIRVGKLAYADSEDTLTLMLTINEEAMMILEKIGKFTPAEDLNWTEITTEDDEGWDQDWDEE